MQLNFKIILIVLLAFIHHIAHCSSSYPKSDILFYKDDTLFVDKIRSDLILRKINKSKIFNTNYAPFKVNQYTAYWRIENNKLYLIKVSNCQLYFCSKENDTLDLQKSFRFKYQNGKVDFTPRKGNIYGFDTFVLRYNYGWYPTFYKNYDFYFENRDLNDIDTTYSYSNDEDKLNRLTYSQIKLAIYNMIYENIKVYPYKTDRKNLYIELSISVDYSGEMSEFSLLHYSGNNYYDSIPKDSIEKIINFKILHSKLEETRWDKIHSNQGIKDNFIFNLKFNLEKDTILDYNEKHKREERRIYNTLPKYIRDIYD